MGRVTRAVAEKLSLFPGFAASVGIGGRTEGRPRWTVESYRALVEAMDDAVNVKDLDGRYLMVNSEQARRFDRGKADIVGKTPWDLYDRIAAEIIMEQHAEVIRSGAALETEQEFPGDPDSVVRHIHRVPLMDDAGHIVAVMTVSRDITDLARTRERLRCQALEDELTGLYNRRGFMALAEHHLKLADRMGTELCMVFIDMDNLKTINDSLGHGKGDEAITAVARVLRGNCREADVVARFGGDEFAILAIDTPPDRAVALIQRVRDAFCAMNAKEWSWHPLSLSIGVVHREVGCPLSISALLAQADSLMYQEKRRKIADLEAVRRTRTALG